MILNRYKYMNDFMIPVISLLFLLSCGNQEKINRKFFATGLIYRSIASSMLWNFLWSRPTENAKADTLKTHHNPSQVMII